MGLLKFDFNKANAQIQELEEIASEIDQLADTDYENLMQQMRSAWKGNAADAYIRKASQVQERIKKTSQDIKKTSEVYANAVKRVQAAEEKVKEIFVSLLGDEWLENISDSFMLPAREPQAESEDSHIFYDESSISIVFDTVYGVKGETHDATLYLETETKKSSDIRRILPLLERKITQCKNELQEKSRRCVYVGFSRPKYLLCLAIGEKTYVGHEAAFSSWKIVDLRSGDTM